MWFYSCLIDKFVSVISSTAIIFKHVDAHLFLGQWSNVMIHYKSYTEDWLFVLILHRVFNFFFGQMDEENGNEITVGDLPAGNLNISQVKIFL